EVTPLLSFRHQAAQRRGHAGAAGVIGRRHRPASSAGVIGRRRRPASWTIRGMDWLSEVRWDENGLVPVIAQEASSGDVLMFAWMNREALQLTADSGRAVYYSRSRSKLWPKGEESGHVQQVHEI